MALAKTQELPPPPELPKGLQITPVFNAFWIFAAERQKIFFQRSAGKREPWTEDHLLQKYRFTNVYRAADRISQYLIGKVMGSENCSDEDMFFRILLFKIFNKIETWELLLQEVGEINWSSYSFKQYDAVLTKALERGYKIYSAAYIMPSGGKTSRKHRFHLMLLERMVQEKMPDRIRRCGSMKLAFELLRSYPSIGDFLAYQFVTDLNYSRLLDFDEMEFVRPGPGARDGMKKCFPNCDLFSLEDLICWTVDTQEAQFERVGVRFPNLWGRRLQLIDCQNIFCEIDKYARHAYPEFRGVSGRVRIKQRFKPKPSILQYRFPEKWHINENVSGFGAAWQSGTPVKSLSAAD